MTGSFLANPHSAIAQQRVVNYDESKIDIGDLPDPLKRKNGTMATAADWGEHRNDLVELLAENQFGFAPSDPFEASAQIVEEGTMHDGQTRRRQYVMHLKSSHGAVDVDVAVFLPTTMPVRGIFVGLNFQGNHSIDDDVALRLPKSWMANNKETGVDSNRASEKGRGAQNRRWPIREITARGYGIATAYYGDIDPDFDDGFQNGVHSLFPDYRPDAEHPNRWGSIAAWAWGMSRILDVLSKQQDIDVRNPIAVGHSRLGKAALWAGVTDPRFQVVISNNSGCGGAALERRNFGETVAIINKAFPHWFCGNFKKFDQQEKQMPHDAHFIIASIAPRPVYIASATEDKWADPRGEYTSGYLAGPAYRLLGHAGLEDPTPPPADQSVGDFVGYHSRTGAHDILSFDWQRYMDFAERHRKK